MNLYDRAHEGWIRWRFFRRALRVLRGVERTHFFCYSVEFKGRKDSAMKSECSRQVGKRKLPKIKGVPSGELLKQGAEWNDEMHRMFPFRYMPRGGVLFFKTMEASNQHEEACRAAAMAKRAKERMHE